MSVIELTPLSASRIKTAETCSFIYYAHYILGVPDQGNDGSSRGTIVHLIAELLSYEKHKDTYDKVVENKNVFCDKALSRLIYYHARRLKVCSDEHLELINSMALVALTYNFFGEELGKPDKSLSEHPFDFICDIDGKLYRAKGFIDRIFIYKNLKKILIRDYKTSKQKYKGHDLEFNLQDYIYRLAILREYPDYETEMEFLFLKFPKSPAVITKPVTKEQLNGFEYYLTNIQNYITTFTPEKAYSSFAKNKGFMKDGSFGGIMKCGKIGFKKDGAKQYCCPYRLPFDYYELLDKDEKVIKSVREEDVIQAFPNEKIGQKMIKKHYSGCPAWW